jgi:hypothetical protein
VPYIEGAVDDKSADDSGRLEKAVDPEAARRSPALPEWSREMSYGDRAPYLCHRQFDRSPPSCHLITPRSANRKRGIRQQPTRSMSANFMESIV